MFPFFKLCTCLFCFLLLLTTDDQNADFQVCILCKQFVLVRKTKQGTHDLEFKNCTCQYKIIHKNPENIRSRHFFFFIKSDYTWNEDILETLQLCLGLPLRLKFVFLEKFGNY